MKKITTLLGACAALFVANTAIAQCSNITFDVNTDGYGYETYWEVTPQGDPCGTNTIASGGNAVVGCAGGGVQAQDPGGYQNNNSTYNETIGCLTDGACFDIHIVDDWGDGSASIIVYNEGVQIASFDGSTIGAGTTWSFCVTAPNNYDAAIANIMPYEYTKVPSFELNTAASLLGDVEVESMGAMGLTNVQVTATVLMGVTPVHTETATIGTLASGANGVASFAAFMPTAVGAYTVVYQVSSTEVDEDNSNNLSGYTFDVTADVYARDNNTQAGSIGIGAGEDGYLGNAFDVLDPYTMLTGAQVLLDNTGNTLDGATFTVEVFATDGAGVPTTSLGTTTGTVGTTATADWYNVTFSTPLNLGAGRYVIALKEDAALQTNIGLAGGNFTTNAGWVSWVSQPWTPVETFMNVTFMLRGVFATSAQVAEMDMMEVAVYPNPAADQITLKNIENGNTIEIINVEGKTVYNAAVNGNAQVVNLDGFAAGVYTVKVTGNNVIGVTRFVKK